MFADTEKKGWKERLEACPSAGLGNQGEGSEVRVQDSGWADCPDVVPECPGKAGIGAGGGIEGLCAGYRRIFPELAAKFRFQQYIRLLKVILYQLQS
jgi:hypothetical protein